MFYSIFVLYLYIIIYYKILLFIQKSNYIKKLKEIEKIKGNTTFYNKINLLRSIYFYIKRIILVINMNKLYMII